MDSESSENIATKTSGTVLVVDDDLLTRELHSQILSRHFTVHAASSGEAAIEMCAHAMPDLVLLDVEMPNLNGYETCSRLRQDSNVPIIFATAHQTIEEHLKAYDAGGDDIVTKPIVPAILVRKVQLAIERKAEQDKLAEEKNSLQSMAMNFLSSVGESGILLNFMRKSLNCRTHDELVMNLVEAAQEFGVETIAMIRHKEGESVLSTHGVPSSLERSILEQSSSMGRIFQFRRNLVVNYDKVSIMSSKLPEDDEEKTGRIRDNITILAETTEAFCENVEMRKESMTRAENLQVALIGAVSAVEHIHQQQSAMLLDVRLMLQALTDSVEKSYSWLGTSGEQEKSINETMNHSVQKILNVLDSSKYINEQFSHVVDILRGSTSSTEADLW